MSHQQSFSYKGTGLPGLNQYLARIYVLAQGHNTVLSVRFKPAAPRSPVKHSTTEWEIEPRDLVCGTMSDATCMSTLHWSIH